MAALRLVLIAAVLTVFFVVGLPLQWLAMRAAPSASRYLPILFCRTLLALLRVDLRAHGASVSDRPLLLVSNHVSWIDILVLGAIMPSCFLAKSDVSSWPFLSAFVDIQGTVFVDRNRRRSIPHANRQLAERMAEGGPALLFPEGTTSDAAAPSRFRSSHFAAARELLRADERTPHVAVQPVAVAYSSRDAAWVGDDDLFSHLWRTLKKPPLRCHVSFGGPVFYERDSDRKHLAKAMREAVVSLLRANSVPVSDELQPSADDIGIPATKTS